MTGTSDLFNIANGTPAVVGPTGSGTISGGLLRPGSIDQQAFQQMLRAQQSNRAAAGVGGKPVSMPVLPFQNGIPSLTSAQFAALVGDQTAEASDSDDAGLAADPQTAMQQANPNYGADLSRRLAFGHAQAMAKLANPTSANPPAANPAAASPNAGANPTMASLPAPPSMLPSSTLPRAAAIRLSGVPSPQVAGLNAAGLNTPGSNTTRSNAAEDSDDAPRIFRGPAGVRPVGQQEAGQQGAGQQGNTQMASAEASPSSASATDGSGKAAPGSPDPSAAASQSTAPSNPNLVHLKEQPDRDMQMKLRLEHKQWVVDETPGSRQLFFGADGKFGWDDFLDVINPLQHIPIISQIYRAVTGDQINGAAELIGAFPLGPLGLLGMAGAIVDLAVKDTTGKDIGSNVEAMIFGNDTGTTDNMAAKPGTNAPNDTSADSATSGSAGPGATETASIGEESADRYGAGIRRGRPG
jgi:hypothetical protein